MSNDVQNIELNYGMPMLTKLYAEINPNITTINTANVVYFNSGDELEDNAYPAKLLDFYTNASATHSNLINLKRNMLIGKGLQPIDPNDQLTTNFLNEENLYGDTLQNVWDKICLDFAVFEAYGLEIIYNKNGLITPPNHIAPNLIRAVANKNPNLPFIDNWMISYHWDRISNKNYRRYTPTTSGLPIANFNPKTWSVDGGRQLMYHKQYTTSNNVYAIPTYNSILQYVELDNALADYNLNSVTKGFTPQTIVALNGNPTKEEKDIFINKFKQKYTSQYGERILFIWTSGQDDKPSIMPFNELDNTPMLKLLDNLLTQKIASGHGANLELAGIQTGSESLGGDANKLAVSYNHFYQTVIKPMQKVMLQGVNKILKVNGLGAVTVETPKLELDNNSVQTAPVPKDNLM